MVTDELQGAADAAIAGESKHSQTSKERLDEAFRLAKEHKLVIVSRREVYRVFRATVPHLTFIGERVDPEALLALVKRAAKATPAK